MSLMTLGPVRADGDSLPPAATAQVRSYPRAFVQDFYRGWRRTDLHHLMHQVVGDAIQVVIEGHVIVDIDPRPRPLAHVEVFAGQRPECGLVERFENARPAAVTLAAGPAVEPVEQLSDRLVDFFQGEELAMAQSRDDPALGHLHRAFHDRLVPRLVW